MFTKLVNALRKKGGIEGFLWNELADMPGYLIVVTDSDFELAWANVFFYNFFECQPREVVGKPMHSFLGEDNRGDMSRAHIDELLEKNHMWAHKARTYGADGEFINIRWNQRVFSDGAGLRWILSVGIPEDKAVPEERAGMSWKAKPEPQNYLGERISSEPIQTADPEISRHISAKNLLLHYQPRVDARTKAIVGAEGLVRMAHPERGLLYPGSFLPGLESRQMTAIADYVINAACKKLSEWQNTEGVMKMTVSVNVAPRHFSDEDYVQSLLAATARYSVPTARLILEMTERDVAANFDEAKRFIETLKAAGFKISIDEFSSSYLSLPNMAALPVDDIALDRAYLIQANQSPANFPLMESIIVFAHGLGRTVTAVGVENRRQLDFLLDHSVDFLQGYMISEPLPEAEFDRFLKTNPDFYTRHI